MAELHQIQPREQSGRDTFARYRAQVRAAGIACLYILEGKEIDRVYCDFHDDFVIRKTVNGEVKYLFFQVKTMDKQNHLWTLNEVFGLKSSIRDQKKQESEKIKSSFIGKLLSHTVTFSDNCEKVTFMTNIHFHDAIEEMVICLENKSYTNKYAKVLLERFDECFTPENEDYSEEEIKRLLAKLTLEPDVSYIKKKHDFFSVAREKVYEFSEIDLEYDESREILISLLNLIEDKSSDTLKLGITKDELDLLAGVQIDDILKILSISKGAYFEIVKSGDPKAIKTTSVIQRTLSASGASDDEIEFCARCKTDWDIWLRENRNKLVDIEILGITTRLDKLLDIIVTNGQKIRFLDLDPKLRDVQKDLDANDLLFDLNIELLLGGFFSALVRFKS